MEEDLAKAEVDNLTLGENVEDDIDNIATVDPTDELTQFRTNMAIDMFNTWQSS